MVKKLFFKEFRSPNFSPVTQGIGMSYGKRSTGRDTHASMSAGQVWEIPHHFLPKGSQGAAWEHAVFILDVWNPSKDSLYMSGFKYMQLCSTNMFQPTQCNICWDMQLWLSFSKENEGKQFHLSLDQHLREDLGLLPFPNAEQILASSAQRNNQIADASAVPGCEVWAVSCRAATQTTCSSAERGAWSGKTSEWCTESNTPRSAPVLTCRWFLSATHVEATQLEVTGEKHWLC